MEERKPSFLKEIDASGVEKVDAGYDTKREWCQDPVGYVVIKIFPNENKIGARFCTNDHKAKYDVIGDDAESIVQTLVRMNLMSSLQHAAYLGHELHKAEVALKKGIEFVQDKPLEF